MQCNDFLKSILCAGALVLAVQSDVVRAGSMLEMDATIQHTACTMKFSPPSPLQLSDVGSSTLTHLVVGGVTPVTLSLTSCGLGVGTTKPTVTLTGTMPSQSEVEGTGAETYSFKDYTDNPTSYRYFIVVANKPNPQFTDADLYRSNGISSVIAGTPGSSGNDANVNLYIGVSCAFKKLCETAKAGTLSAKLTFTFAYK